MILVHFRRIWNLYFYQQFWYALKNFNHFFGLKPIVLYTLCPLFGNKMCLHWKHFLLIHCYRAFGLIANSCALGVSLHTVRFAVVYLTALWAKISCHLFDNCHRGRVNFHDAFALANFQMHTPCIYLKCRNYFYVRLKFSTLF